MLLSWGKGERTIPSKGGAQNRSKSPVGHQTLSPRMIVFAVSLKGKAGEKRVFLMDVFASWMRLKYVAVD